MLLLKKEWASSNPGRVVSSVDASLHILFSMEQHSLKNSSDCLNTNLCSYLETLGGKSYNLYWNGVHFSIPELIRHLWQPKTVILLHWCLIVVVPLLLFAILMRCFSILSKLMHFQLMPFNLWHLLQTFFDCKLCL